VVALLHGVDSLLPRALERLGRELLEAAGSGRERAELVGGVRAVEQAAERALGAEGTDPPDWSARVCRS
jgi:hypothetical protein